MLLLVFVFVFWAEVRNMSYQQPVSAGQSLVITPTVALRDMSLYK